MAERAAFVLGCQRSGTTMLLDALGMSDAISIHHESDAQAMDDDFRIRGREEIETVIASDPGVVAAFKPICDSHYGDLLLNRHPGSLGIWIYRSHRDVARSFVRKWGDHPKDVVDLLGNRNLEQLTWRGERLSDEAWALVDEIADLSPSAEDCAALMWYLRNRHYLEFRFFESDRQRLIRYEQLVREPAAHLGELFEFLGVELSQDSVAHVSSRNVGKGRDLELHPRVDELCAELTEQLEEVARSS